MELNGTNTSVDTTQQSQAGSEENSINQEQTFDSTQQSEANQIENSQENNDGNQQQEELQQQSQQPTEAPTQTVEELQAKLNEYQLREEEDRQLRERLGIHDVDQQTYNLMNLDQQIVNEGKQIYLRLCNEYGVDARPDKLDSSVQELMKTDPQKAYEFQRRFDSLSNEVISKRNEVKMENAVYEVTKFENDYSQLLNASPAISNIIRQYVSQYGDTGNMYGQLKGVMDMLLPAYQEAYYAGKMFASSDKAKKDTSAVNGGLATANTQTYSPGQTFTRDQIRRMSPEEFAKNEKFIQQQMIEGKIQ